MFGYFFYYTLDMAICPYLASIFGMPIWHPTKEAEVDELLNAGVKSNATLCFGHALRAVMQSFPGVWTRMGRNLQTFFFSREDAASCR